MDLKHGEGIIFDVAVIGAGVMGSSTAYYLSKKGNIKVALFEQFDFLHRQGSSHGDSRIIRMTYPQAHYTELMSPAYRMWNDLEMVAGTKLLTKTGGIDIGRESNEELQSLLSIARKYNVPHEVLNEHDLSLRFPTLQIPKHWIAIYSPSSGILRASKAVGVFQNMARKQGAYLFDNVKIVKVVASGYFHEIIADNGKVFRAKKVIYTTGPWTKKVLGENLKMIDLPLHPEQVTTAYWKVDNPEAYAANKFPVFINYEDPLIYGTPALEFPGLIKCAVHGGKEVDPDKRDFMPGTEALEKKVRPFLESVFRGVSGPPVMTESCIYTWTPDMDFIIDTIPGTNDSVYIGCGFSGHGFKLAPVVGYILSELATTGKHPFPRIQHIFSIERFKSNKTKTQSKM